MSNGTLNKSLEVILKSKLRVSFIRRALKDVFRRAGLAGFRRVLVGSGLGVILPWMVSHLDSTPACERGKGHCCQVNGLFRSCEL